LHVRLRKLIGSVILLVTIPIYVLLATALANVALPGTSGWVQAAYYVVAGLAWTLPAGVLVTWMVKPRPGELRKTS
jgi:hypothetical protein